MGIAVANALRTSIYCTTVSTAVITIPISLGFHGRISRFATYQHGNSLFRYVSSGLGLGRQGDHTL